MEEAVADGQKVVIFTGRREDCDRLAEEMEEKLKGVDVISRTTMQTFKDSKLTLSEIARKLNAPQSWTVHGSALSMVLGRPMERLGS